MMAAPSSTGLVLFRVAAGPRLGFGHLRRAEVLARALAMPARISVRGAGQPQGRLAGVDAGSAGATLDGIRPTVLVIDDPHAAHGCRWVAAAARRDIPVISLHDLGLARVASTLAIDGSIVSPARGWPARRVLRGLPYAVIGRPRRRRAPGEVRRVLVSLGGGARGPLTRAVATALAERHPGLEIVVTRGWSPDGWRAPAGVRLVDAPDGLAPWFARVDAAVVGGGVSLYEAVAAGVPTVAVAVVPAQRPTIRGFADAGLTIDGGAAEASPERAARRISQRVATVTDDHRWRERVWRDGPRAVDGRGAERVARAIGAVVAGAAHA